MTNEKGYNCTLCPEFDRCSNMITDNFSKLLSGKMIFTCPLEDEWENLEEDNKKEEEMMKKRFY